MIYTVFGSKETNEQYKRLLEIIKGNSETTLEVYLESNTVPAEVREAVNKYFGEAVL